MLCCCVLADELAPPPRTGEGPPCCPGALGLLGNGGGRFDVPGAVGWCLVVPAGVGLDVGPELRSAAIDRMFIIFCRGKDKDRREINCKPIFTSTRT